MKKIITIFGLLIFALAANAQEPVKAPNENGKYEEKSGKHIVVSGNCSNGYKTGLWSYYNTAGVLEKEEEFDKNGYLVMVKKQDNSTGYWTEFSYRMGVLHGKTRSSFNHFSTENDPVINSGWYKNGKKDSTWNFYRVQKQVWKSEKWKDGNLLEVATFFASGKLLDRITYNDKGELICQVYYNEQGVLIDSLLAGDPYFSQQAFSFVEEMPVFPGGESAFFKYLVENVRYPVLLKENGIQGTVMLSFDINRYGKAENIKVVKAIPNGSALDKEAIRVFEQMPLWTPGKMNGRVVKVTMVQPVKFALQ